MARKMKKEDKRLKKKMGLLMAFAGMLVLLSGCGQTNEPINAESTGFWNQFIVYPLSQFITWVSNLFGGNYGIGIIVATLIVRFAIMPLMLKQIKSTKAMQAMQPEIKELQKKYSSKDQATQQKLQQETMALYKKYGVNPMAGCFPMLIQMPVLFGFWQAIMRTPAIAEQSFLWFELGEQDPFFILPITAAITTFLSQKISMAGNSSDNPQMKMMLYIMPVMILMGAVSLPAALPMYWIIGNLFTIFQTMIVRGPEMREAAKARGEKK